MIRKKQNSGITSIGVITIIVVAVLTVFLLVKILPAIVEYGVIDKLANQVSKDNYGQAKSTQAVRNSFDNYLSVNGVDHRTITSDDIEIERLPDKEGVLIKFAYEKKIFIGDSVYLGILFSGETDQD